MLRRVFVALLVGIAAVMTSCEAARILCVFPTPSISHQIGFRGLTLELNKRGHELVVITTDPIRDESLKNYTEIDVHFLYDNDLSINWIDIRRKLSMLDIFNELVPHGNSITERLLSLPEFKKIWEPNSGEHFDLVMMEVFYSHAYYPLVRRFEAPWIGLCEAIYVDHSRVSLNLKTRNLFLEAMVFRKIDKITFIRDIFVQLIDEYFIIGVTSMGLGAPTHYAIGNPLMPSHPSSWELGYEVSELVSFWKRINDYIKMWMHLFVHRMVCMPEIEKIARKHFGDNGSTITEIRNNMSIILVNQQLPISFVRPNVPKVVEFGGFHVAKEAEPLHKDLKEFLDGAIEGFVYMSLGSNVKTSMLSSKMRQDFISAFAKLPYKVLWKNEEEFLLEKPDNVHTMTWVPQQSVLAHPNIKVFIYQGGLQSTEEAVHHAVPLIGFPIFGDQDSQILKMVSVGVCRQLEITDFTADDLFEAITTVATDPSYKERMLDLRSRIYDRPYDPLENAVWWVEYVIRHGGISHLHSSTADLPWYQRGDADIVAFITASFLISLSLLLAILYRLCVFLFMLSPVKRKEKSN